MATQVGIVSKGKLIFQDSIEAMRRFAQPKVTFKVNNGEKGWRFLLANGIKADYQGGVIFLEECSDERLLILSKFLFRRVYRYSESRKRNVHWRIYSSK